MSFSRFNIVTLLSLLSIVAVAHGDPAVSGTGANPTTSAERSFTPEQKAEIKKRWVEFMKKHDLNRNGKIDKEEQAQAQIDMKRQQKEWIFRWDLNHDGKLDKWELARIPANAVPPSVSLLMQSLRIKNAASSGVTATPIPQLTGSNQ